MNTIRIGIYATHHEVRGRNKIALWIQWREGGHIFSELDMESPRYVYDLICEWIPDTLSDRYRYTISAGETWDLKEQAHEYKELLHNFLRQQPLFKRDG